LKKFASRIIVGKSEGGEAEFVHAILEKGKAFPGEIEEEEGREYPQAA